MNSERTQFTTQRGSWNFFKKRAKNLPEKSTRQVSFAADLPVFVTSSSNPHLPSTSFPSTPDSQSQLIKFVKTLDTKLIERLPVSHSKPGPNPRRPTETKAY